MNALATWAWRTVSLIYPRNCQFCAASLPETEPGVICGECLGKKVRWIEPPFCQQCALPFSGKITDTFVCGYCRDLRFHFERTVCACRAEGLVRDSIHRFKYNREMYFGPHLAEWLLHAARQWIEWREVDAIVPVPLHPRKKREREFNQAEHLANALSHAFGMPVLTGQLRRVKDTVTQTALDAGGRAANLRGAFALRQTAAVAGKRLVLVDDVFTTGATMDSCAKVLRVAGAQRVMAVARGI
jgi:ComF family protein